jgi:hypothetical protein
LAKAEEGNCHLCGNYGPLSFEHVPPESAFNDRPVLLGAIDDVWDTEFDDSKLRGKIQQRGAGAFTLCRSCNSFTGYTWAPGFASWCHQGMEIMYRASGRPTLIYMNYVLPLHVLKQICTMFFSVNGPRFRERHPWLENFVLNRESQALPEEYRVYAYFMGAGHLRYSGVASWLQMDTGQQLVLSEITFPPYGYVLCFDHVKPHPDLYDITFFRRFHYREFAVVNLRLPVLQTHLPLPGDYRSKEQIERGSALSF